jgi:hypothetical protein
MRDNGSESKRTLSYVVDLLDVCDFERPRATVEFGRQRILGVLLDGRARRRWEFERDYVLRAGLHRNRRVAHCAES